MDTWIFLPFECSPNVNHKVYYRIENGEFFPSLDNGVSNAILKNLMQLIFSCNGQVAMDTIFIETLHWTWEFHHYSKDKNSYQQTNNKLFIFITNPSNLQKTKIKCQLTNCNKGGWSNVNNNEDTKVVEEKWPLKC